MILNEFVDVNITVRNITYFKEKGYKPILNEKLKVDTSDLARNSRLKINVKCSECGIVNILKYCKYLSNFERYGFYTCKKCSHIKKKITFMNNYGVDNPMKCDEIKQKGKNTKKEKYGDENYNNLEKHTQTNLEKFGTRHHLQNNDIKEKQKQTNLKRYGFEHFSKNEEYINKIKHNNLLKNIKYYKDKYDFNIIGKDDNNYTLICEKCNNKFNINSSTLKSRFLSNIEICTTCNPINSTASYKELDFFNFISDNYDSVIITNDKITINPYELDIYLPDLNLSFEFNGIYWHNELYCDKDYHKNKTDLCLEKSIQLIHVYEDEWMFKKDIVKSMILNKLNKTPNKIFARKCEIKEVTDNKTIKKFLEENHIQGFVGSKIKIGLYYDNELVSLMNFGKLRNMMKLKSKVNEYEMLRFCNKLNTNIVGGASKIFKYFIKNYKPNMVISYADRSYSNGNLYKQLGFKLESITSPNYYYVINRTKENRFNYRKSELIKQGFDSNKTEHEIMLERKLYRIYNSGNYKFIYKQKL